MSEQYLGAASRRTALKTIGAGVVGSAALSGTASAIKGDTFTRSPQTYGQYDVSYNEDLVYGRDIAFLLRYEGYNPDPDIIEHKFAASMLGHTWAGDDGSLYDGTRKTAGGAWQGGSKFLVYKDSKVDIQPTLSDTYPGYIPKDTADTKYTWSDIVKDSDEETISEYRDEVYNEVLSDKSDFWANAFAFVAAEVADALFSGLGTALSLANLFFGRNQNIDGSKRFTDGPVGYEWDINAAAGDRFPLNWHHVKFDAVVPNDGNSYTMEIEQFPIELEFDDQFGEDAAYYKVDLPGYDASASPADTYTYNEF